MPAPRTQRSIRRSANAGFFSRVYALTAQIPRGQVATYGQLAALAGNPMAARMVGWAMASTPPELKLPCHRVIAATGRLAPARIFAGKQRARLMAERIPFLRDGRVDLARCQWNGRPGRARRTLARRVVTRRI